MATRALCAPCPRTPCPVLCALCLVVLLFLPPSPPHAPCTMLSSYPIGMGRSSSAAHYVRVPRSLGPLPSGDSDLWLCCFAGVNFFGTIEGFEPHYGFSTFGLSLNSLFRVCTRISWEDIMYKVRWHWVHVHAVGHPMLELGAVLPHL